MARSRSNFRGAILGHALGDALGAPVEFKTRSEILRLYGPDGIRGPEPWGQFAAGSFTDDTQMMMATARGLLDFSARWALDPSAEVSAPVWSRYLEWLDTQDHPGQSRFPGDTCLASLRAGVPGDTFDPINDRKGSGGIMRVTPAGLLFEPERAFETAIELAALTHGHESGYLAAGAYADLISRVVSGDRLDLASAAVRELLLGWEDEASEVLDAYDHARELYMSDVHPIEGNGLLGEGWVAEEALAIALYCSLSYPADWVEGTLAAVNITGDSDTTGCLTGALLGAALGEDALPAEWLDVLEDAEELTLLADRLWHVYSGSEPAADSGGNGAVPT